MGKNFSLCRLWPQPVGGEFQIKTTENSKKIPVTTRKLKEPEIKNGNRPIRQISIIETNI